jgi:hypothetical protein
MKYKLASLQHFFLNAARWAGQRLPIFISDPRAPAGRDGRWIKTVPVKKLSEMS